MSKKNNPVEAGQSKITVTNSNTKLKALQGKSQFTIFETWGSKQAFFITLEEFLKGVRGGRWENQVNAVRRVVKEGNKVKIKKEKNKLAFTTPHGTFYNEYDKKSGFYCGGHAAECFKEASGLFCADIDDLTADKLKEAKEALKADKLVKAFFVSPSGNGIKVFIETTFKGKQGGAEKAKVSFKALFEQFKNYFKRNYGLEIDKACSNLNRGCFVSHDKNAYFNPKAEIFEFIETKPEPEPKAKKAKANEVVTLMPEVKKERLAAIVGQQAERVRMAPAGEGNATLNEAAHTLGGYGAGEGLSKEDAKKALVEAYESRNEKPAGEAEKTFYSGWNSGLNEPLKIELEPAKRELEAAKQAADLTFQDISTGEITFVIDKDGVSAMQISKTKGFIKNTISTTPIKCTSTTNKGGAIFSVGCGKEPQKILLTPDNRIDSKSLRLEFLKTGIALAPSEGRKDLFVQFIEASYAHTKDKLGIHKKEPPYFGWIQEDDYETYISPLRVYGKENDYIQMEFKGDHGFSQKGSLEDWKKHISMPCRGNSRFVFAICAAFGAKLLSLLNAENGGFHFFGASGSGKTAALRVAASVAGRGERGYFIDSWSMTNTAREVKAGIRNDSILIFDEAGQGKNIPQTAYFLGNGVGKARSNAALESKESTTFKLLFLSSGESLAMQEAEETGEATYTGQALRMVDIEMNTGTIVNGVDYRGLEEIHGAKSPAEFVEALERATNEFYGTAEETFIELLISQIKKEGKEKFIEKTTLEFKEICNAFTDSLKKQGREVSQQEERAVKIFAIAALGGIIATRGGATGWEDKEALEAGRKCFISAMLNFSEGSGQDRENEKFKNKLLEVLETKVDRFMELKIGANGGYEIEQRQRDLNLWGFYTKDNFYIISQAFSNQIFKGNGDRAAKILIEMGTLLDSKLSGKRGTRQITIEGHGRPRVYTYPRERA